MNKYNGTKQTQQHNTTVISGKEYIVKSVFRDDGDNIESMILKLAERKTIHEMGLDVPLEKSRTA